MEFDEETGLYHTWFRQYDPSQGRWLSIDPLSGSEADSQSLNRYTYVASDPVNFVDPLGLQEEVFTFVEVGEDDVCRLHGFDVPCTLALLQQGTISALDRGTARGNYVSNVLAIAKHCFRL